LRLWQEDAAFLQDIEQSIASLAIINRGRWRRFRKDFEGSGDIAVRDLGGGEQRERIRPRIAPQ
jgi:hypothetical protein